MQYCVECFLVERTLSLISIIGCIQIVMDVNINRLSIIHKKEWCIFCWKVSFHSAIKHPASNTFTRESFIVLFWYLQRPFACGWYRRRRNSFTHFMAFSNDVIYKFSSLVVYLNYQVAMSTDDFIQEKRHRFSKLIFKRFSFWSLREVVYTND